MSRLFPRSPTLASPKAPPGLRPGAGWRWARRLTQTLALIALLVGPLLGGWQRLDYSRERSSWNVPGFGLPAPLRERLPLAASPETLYRANRVMGGGIAAELFAIPFMDPLAGTLALLGRGVSWVSLIAIVIPVGLALLGGRIFCGWFCSFGILARGLDAVCARIPHVRHFALPRRRAFRWGLLAAAVAASLFGSHLLLYLLLPFLLLQQSVYAVWLLGGGSAVLGVLGGLVAAGLVFGPTTYCAALCPTGASLSLLGRRRVFRLSQVAPAACGKHCDLCHRACWLQLDPTSGDPGPDCDLCARCVPSCPRTNLVVSATRRARARHELAVLAALFAVLATPAEARDANQPTLLFEAVVERGSTVIAASAIDFTGFHLGPDWAEAEQGVDLSVFIARGELEGPAADGIIPSRETYRGPLRIEIRRSEKPLVSLAFDEPNSPISAQRRRIYRRRLPFRMAPGDRIRLEAIPGWFDEEVTLRVPEPGVRVSLQVFGQYFAVSALAFAGLLCVAILEGRRPSESRRAGAPASPILVTSGHRLRRLGPPGWLSRLLGGCRIGPDSAHRDG